MTEVDGQTTIDFTFHSLSTMIGLEEPSCFESELCSGACDTGSIIRFFHGWLANSALPLIASKYGLCDKLTTGALEDLIVLHRRAFDGEKVIARTWQDVLQPILQSLFLKAFPADQAYARAYASAIEFAGKNRKMIEQAFGSAEAYGQYYGDLNTKAAAEFSARANAHAHARLAAAAYQTGEVADFIRSQPHIRIKAIVKSVPAEQEETLRQELVYGLKAAVIANSKV